MLGKQNGRHRLEVAKKGNLHIEAPAHKPLKKISIRNDSLNHKYLI